jgi:hypothetical protein
MILYAVIGEGWEGEDEDNLQFTLPKAFFWDKEKAEKLAKKYNSKADHDYYGPNYSWVVHEYIIDEVKKKREKKNADVCCR